MLQIFELAPWIFIANFVILVGVSFFTFSKLKKIGSLPHVAYTFCFVAIFLSTMILFGVGQIFQEKTKEKLLGYAPSYAKVFEMMKHRTLSEATADGDAVYNSFIELEKAWLNVNPFVSDIYTMKRNKSGETFLMVDSETDYDHNGKFEGEREARTKIGDIYEKILPELQGAFSGVSGFTERPYSDKWGTWVSAFVPLHGAHGEVESVLGIDFSAQVYLQEVNQNLFSVLLLILIIYSFLCSLYYSFRKSLKIANAASELKEQFTASISHEIRTPLNGIIGASRLLGDTSLDSLQKNYAHIIHSCSSHLLDLVDDVMDYSKIRSKGIQLESIKFNLTTLVSESLQVFALQAKEKNNLLKFEVDDESSFWVQADPTRIRQMVINLVSNANKFTDHGNITVRLSRAPKIGESETHCQYSIGVQDTGGGISEEDQTKLFRPYAQAKSSTTRLYGGTGLGLAITKDLCELMGGRISLKSALGVGSEFSIQVPLVSVQTPKNAAGHTRITSKNQYSLKALVVDDIQINRIVLGNFLQKWGLECSYAGDGAEAWSCLEKEAFDVVFLDCYMPEVDGFLCAQKISQNLPQFHKVTIVAVTASTEEHERKRCFENGMNYFLPKPVKTEALQSILDKIVEEKGRRSGHAA